MLQASEKIINYLFVALCILLASNSLASVKPAPDRKEGEGPYKRLIIRGANVIDGTGAPMTGPQDIVIEGNKIVQIADVGYPNLPIKEKNRPNGATKEIDAHGMYVLPGLINMHCHVGSETKAPEAEYVYKLWMAHGITTVRCVPAGEIEWSLNEKKRSAENKITAPRIVSYHTIGQGWNSKAVTVKEARKRVKRIAKLGGDGIKIFNVDPDIFAAITDEAKKQKLGTVAHLSQLMVGQTNARDAANMGLGTLTHYYGLFEALYKDSDIQPWPAEFNYKNEQDRFSRVAYNWNRIHPRGSKPWNDLIQTFLNNDLTLDPTMTAYLASRDVMKSRNADWHDKYTLPSLWQFYTPSRENHGSYFFNWTTWDEVAWKNFYRVWMSFINDYKNAGGRVTISDDAAFIYNQYGFGYVEEMELLQEAGFHPLEVIRSATKYAAETIYKPKGKAIEYGVIRPGKLADLLIVAENPIANLKVLYATGAIRLNDKTGQVERVGGVKYTIKDGIIYDAKALLKDVEKMVIKQKSEKDELKKY